MVPLPNGQGTFQQGQRLDWRALLYIYAGLGDLDAAFEWQDKAFEAGASPFQYLSPATENMHSDPRFLDDLRAWGVHV